jgi:hypothetical protein
LLFALLFDCSRAHWQACRLTVGPALLQAGVRITPKGLGDVTRLAPALPIVNLCRQFATVNAEAGLLFGQVNVIAALGSVRGTGRGPAALRLRY